ncbi:MAG: hypothetical protein R6V56_08825, partial [Lentisphaeria bacterium]
GQPATTPTGTSELRKCATTPTTSELRKGDTLSVEPTSPSASCHFHQRLGPRTNENKRKPAPAEHNQRDSPRTTRNNSDGDVGAT